MKFIDLEQGSQAWHDYREIRIGASDAPVIMGLSPYCIAALLYKRKKKLAPPSRITEAMGEGTRLEPIAREDAEHYLKMEIPPAVVEMEEFPFLFASLDGINVAESFIVEIKCSKNIYESARAGYISPMYHCQMQHQLMVTGYKKCLFFAFDGFSHVCIWVDRDEKFIEEMKGKLIEFYACLQNNEEPYDENAYMTIEIDNQKNDVLERWIESIKKLRDSQKEEKHWSEEIKNWGDDLNCELVHDGKPKLRMTRVQRMGNVDWNSLCVAKGISEIDIAPFRKKEIGYYKLTEIRS